MKRMLVIGSLVLAGCTASGDRVLRVDRADDQQRAVAVDATMFDASPVDVTYLNTSPYEKIGFKAANGSNGSFDLYSFELDDDGTLFQRGQIDTVCDRIRESAKERGAIIVVFVHGWKHNATPCDGNISCFRTVLRKLADDEQTHGRNRVVAGVYLGWRGLGWCDEPAKEVTFYGRKAAAERVGSAEAREILHNLREVHEQLNDPKNKAVNAAAHGIPSRLVIVGHSFGAALVHAAVLPDMTQDIRSARRKAEQLGTKQLERIDGYGDLVVIVNPAFEAQRFDVLSREMMSLRANGYSFASDQKPVYVVVSSVGDKPTHYAFPTGQSLGLLLQPLKIIHGPAYWLRYVTTVGHYGPYRTHEAQQITPIEGGMARRVKDQSCFPDREQTLPSSYPTCSCDQATFGAMTRAIAVASTHLATAGNDVYGNVRLIEYKKAQDAHLPFWVIKAQTNVVASHNDIFNPTFVSMLYGMVTKVADQRY